MRTLSIPSQLRLIAVLILMSIPAVALQLILIYQIPIWKLPYQNVRVWLIATALISVPLSYWMSLGKAYAYTLTSFFALIWVLISVVVAIKSGSFWFGFMALVLASCWVLVLSAARRQLSKSYLYTGTKWYEGLPQSVPHLECEFIQDQEGFSIDRIKVSRFDYEGCFVYLEGIKNKKDFRAIFKKMKNKKWNLVFRYHQEEIHCQAIPICSVDLYYGIGLKFEKMSPDRKKEAFDFFENLKGIGYV